MLMAKYIRILLIALIIASCNASEKALLRGNYDLAFNKSLRKVRKNPSNDKQAVILEKSFYKSRAAKKDRIDYLNKEGDPDRWEEVFNMYSILKTQQDLIRSLPKLYIENENREINFSKIDYDNEIIEAKKKAAEYFYQNGKKLLGENNRMKAREAYYAFEKIDRFYTNYKAAYNLKNEAKEKGTNKVLYKMVNSTPVPLPPAFEDELKKISLHELNREWINYYTTKTKDTYYDYDIIVHLKNIAVSPEEIKEASYTQQKEIKVEGEWQYVLDDKGNVKKDENGNDIKLPKYKTIYCTIKETYQRKSARITGTVDYYDNRTRQLIEEIPVTSETHFEHISATKDGNLDALNDETRAKVVNYLKNEKILFPPDFRMLTDAGVVLKDAVKNIIWSKKDFLK